MISSYHDKEVGEDVCVFLPTMHNCHDDLCTLLTLS